MISNVCSICINFNCWDLPTNAKQVALLSRLSEIRSLKNRSPAWAFQAEHHTRVLCPHQMASPAQMPTSIGYVWKNQASGLSPQSDEHCQLQFIHEGTPTSLVSEDTSCPRFCSCKHGYGAGRSQASKCTNPAGGSVAFLSGPKAPLPPVQLMLQQWYFQALVCLAPDLSKWRTVPFKIHCSQM